MIKIANITKRETEDEVRNFGAGERTQARCRVHIVTVDDVEYEVTIERTSYRFFTAFDETRHQAWNHLVSDVGAMLVNVGGSRR